MEVQAPGLSQGPGGRSESRHEKRGPVRNMAFFQIQANTDGREITLVGNMKLERKRIG